MGVSERLSVYRLPAYIRERSVECPLAKIFLEGLLDQAGIVLYHICQLLQVVCPVMERTGYMSCETGLKPIVGLKEISSYALRLPKRRTYLFNV
jgi:hypothetical protein